MRSMIGAALWAAAAVVQAQTASAPPPAPASAPAAASVSSPAKKELVARVLKLQQAGIENLARVVAERPAMQMMQAAGNALQAQVPPEKREAAGKSIEADVRKFVDEAVPLLRERAVKLAPTTFGAALESSFSEDELKQLITWLESPVTRKYQQMAPEAQNTLVQKLVGEAGPLLDPKLQALQQKVRATLTSAAGGAPASGAGASEPAARPAPAKAAAPSRPASK